MTRPGSSARKMSEETPPASGVRTTRWSALTSAILRKEWTSSDSSLDDGEAGSEGGTSVIKVKKVGGTLFACAICPIISAPDPNALMRLGVGPRKGVRRL